jgi:hypothetical protein
LYIQGLYVAARGLRRDAARDCIALHTNHHPPPPQTRHSHITDRLCVGDDDAPYGHADAVLDGAGLTREVSGGWDGTLIVLHHLGSLSSHLLSIVPARQNLSCTPRSKQ